MNSNEKRNRKGNYIIFGAVDIGSYEIRMKIFEISKKKGIHEIDHVRRILVLGRDTYEGGVIENDLVDQLCIVLHEFRQIMRSYHVDVEYVYATSAIREAKNKPMVLHQIRVRTGFEVEVLDNAKQRFLGYKSIASKEDAFRSMILHPTAIVDMDGGSLQISLFDREHLVTTQNLKAGILRVMEKIFYLENMPDISRRDTGMKWVPDSFSMQMSDATVRNYEELVEELIGSEIREFMKLYLKERNIRNVVAVSDFMTQTLRKLDKSVEGYAITAREFEELYGRLKRYSTEEIISEMQISSEYARLLQPAMIIYKRVIKEMGAQYLWIPGTYLNDGVAYDYAEKRHLIRSRHDFEKDILESAKHLSGRYAGCRSHMELLDAITIELFDAIKRVSGLRQREGLLLRIAVLLKDCGHYISLSNPAESSYNIIRATELIGLSLKERDMVAYAVRNMTLPMIAYEELTKSLGMEEAVTVIKLSAILKLVNAMDLSYKQKFQSIRAVLKEKELVITVDTREDITLEKALFRVEADAFLEVFHVRPVFRQKRSW